MIMKKLAKASICLVLTGFFVWSFLGAAQTAKPAVKPDDVKISFVEDWLVAGPGALPLPASTSNPPAFQLKDVLGLDPLDPISLWPEQGTTVAWLPGGRLTWTPVKTKDGVLTISPASRAPEAALLFSYLESSRWRKAKLIIAGPSPVKAYFDGTVVLTKNDAAPAEAEIVLSEGTHRLFVFALRGEKVEEDWTIKASFESAEAGPLISSASPKRLISRDDLSNAPRVGAPAVAPDGKAVAYTMTRRLPKTGQSESWIEIRKVPGGELEQVFRDSQGRQTLRWSPDGKSLSALVPGDKGTMDLWILDRETKQTRVLLDDVQGLLDASWSPTGSFLIYAVTEEPKDPSPKVEKLSGLDDRWTRLRGKTHLYAVSVDSGVRRRLTAGDQSAAGLFGSVESAVSPDGTQALFLTAKPDYAHRPYVETKVHVLDLAAQEDKVVFSSPVSIGSARWSLDGRKILLIGGQSLAGKPAGKRIPNDYDLDLFVLDPVTGGTACLTRDFKPSVKSALQAGDGTIYLHAEDRLQEPLYTTDEKGSAFHRIETGLDTIKSFDIDPQGRTLAFIGTSISVPERLMTYDTATGKIDVIEDPAGEAYKDVTFTKVEDFAFKNKSGADIDGWLLYPANFDPGKKYPLIVYYYGGTAHTPKEFNAGFLGANHNLYAARGYAVYVLNPSGAPGWGPGFSDVHVNDWGRVTADEIITGVRKVLVAKPFLDASRVGCHGGSYGGFTTMLLATRTDIFRSCIALYGISNITSYWGAGWWGFLYSGVATAGSFPWNRPDIYVGQSPIFNADKIRTPMLLLHGLADINVPATESEQMFTALKILGREVSYVRFKDEDHGIMGTDENRRLMPEIMLAWWDKYLKGEPEAWEDFWQKK
jgi:dipeptidyl aminopeptidase/acylaminoacyl peptidase